MEEEKTTSQAEDIQAQMAELDFEPVATVEPETDAAPDEKPEDRQATEPASKKNDVNERESVAPEAPAGQDSNESPEGKEAKSEKPEPDDVRKLREQIENLNGALREERAMRKRAQEEARQAALRQVAPVQAPLADVQEHGLPKTDDEADIDPDVERTISKVIAPKVSALEQTIRMNRYQLDEIRVSQEFGAKEFAEASAAFAELINPQSDQFDPGMLKAFQESDRPALLAFNMGRARSIDALLEKARSAGREEGRQSVVADLTTKGKTIPSLSGVGGSPRDAGSATGLRRELDEL